LSLVCLAGCVSNKHLEELRAQVVQERAKLAIAAEPYRIKDVDLAMEVEKAPIDTLINDFNSLSESARTFDIRSYDKSGYLKYHKWFKCPWPLHGNASWFIRLAFDEAFLAHLKLGRFGNKGWSAGTGLNFSIQAGMLAGGVAIGYIDNCLWETPVVGVVIVGAAQENFRGHMTPIVDNTGAQFELTVTDPAHITLLATAYLTGIGTIPFWLNLDPLEDLGTIKVENIVGKEGRLENKLTDVCRPYKLDLTMTKAELLQAGLGVAGKTKVVWEAAGPCPK
jgi:hypothetical protein